MIIDFHNHFYPPEYVERLRTEPGAYRVTIDNDNNPVLHSPGDYNILVPGHRLVDVRKREMAAAGVKKQVLSITTPGTLIEMPERSVELAKYINDLLAAVQKHNDVFFALGTLPLNVPDACVDELERGVSKLNLKGFMLFSNVNGIALSDRCFWPLYERANEIGAIFHIHPTFPASFTGMEDYMLVPLIGFIADTTLAVSQLLFSGVFERFPKIKWVLGHLGGSIPFLAERLDRGYEAFPECREYITKLPSDYLKGLYYDTVNFDPKAIRFVVEFAGADHVLAGSDYPHRIGSMVKMVSSINQLDISAEDRAAILGGNAARLLGPG